MAWIAASAEDCSAKVTNPNPRERPVPGSLENTNRVRSNEREREKRRRGDERHDNAVSDLTELRESITKGIVVGSPVKQERSENELAFVIEYMQ